MKKDVNIRIIGCGYIGRLLAKKLLAQHVSVAGVVSRQSSVEECARNGIACSRIDLDDESMCNESSLDVNAFRLIYLVPPPRQGRQDSRLANFLQLIQNQMPEKIVLISTTGVYGNCHGEWVTEDTAIKPNADRAWRRADAEQQMMAFCENHDIPLVILRVPGIYGPGKLPVMRIKKGDPIVCQEDSPYTNRIHAHDLVSICETALLSNEVTGIYNVSDGNPGTMYDYFMAVADAENLPRPPVIRLLEAEQQLSAGMMSYMAESRRIDNSKLLRDFAIKLKYPDLKTGLAVKG